MDERDGFLAAIEEEPEDTTVKLVFADWLEEHGDPRSELLRREVEIAEVLGWRNVHGILSAQLFYGSLPDDIVSHAARMDGPNAYLRESSGWRTCPPGGRVRAPTSDRPGRLDAARESAPGADLQEGAGGWTRFSRGIGAPANQCAVGPDSARMGSAGLYLLEWPRRGARRARVIAPPADHFTTFFNAAAVHGAGTDLHERTGAHREGTCVRAESSPHKTPNSSRVSA